MKSRATVAGILLLCTGCVIDVTGPYTGTKYTFGVDEEGMKVKAKPIAWEPTVKTIKSWLTD